MQRKFEIFVTNGNRQCSYRCLVLWKGADSACGRRFAPEYMSAADPPAIFWSGNPRVGVG